MGVNACPSCFTPTALAVTNVTTTGADFGWTAGGTETAWNVEYGPAGFTLGSGTLVAVTTNPYTLSGLTSSTDYDVYIQADCGGGDVSPWSVHIHLLQLVEHLHRLPVDLTMWDQFVMVQEIHRLFNGTGPNHVGNGGTLTGSTASAEVTMP